MCEVIPCGHAHPRVSVGGLLLTGLVCMAPGKTEGAVDGSVVELGMSWQATGKVVGGAGVRRGQTMVTPLREGSWGCRALILHRQLLLD